MPNLDEFLNKKEKLFKTESQQILGSKPCSKCDKDSKDSYWDPIELQLTWVCSDGHQNIFQVG